MNKRKTRSGSRGSSAPRTAVSKVNDLAITGILWRLDRLERQVKTLSELVRDHAEDADRLVRIVGQDHDMLRRELLRAHEQQMKSRKRRQGIAGRPTLV